MQCPFGAGTCRLAGDSCGAKGGLRYIILCTYSRYAYIIHLKPRAQGNRGFELKLSKGKT